MCDSILGNSQTYIGLLATFIVLCLFISKSENFIIYTILKVRDENIKHLAAIVEDIKAEIKANSENVINGWIIALDNLTPANQSNLLRNRRNTMMVTQQFIHRVSGITKEFAPEIESKEELPYIALMSLGLIITVMLVDCLNFLSIESRSLFINLLLCVSCVFISVLYHKFFCDSKGDLYKDTQHKQKHSVRVLLVSLFLLFFGWIACAPFINVAWVGIIIIGLLQILIGYVIKNKWIYQCHYFKGYSRSIVLQHYVIFIIYVAAITGIMSYWTHFLTFIGYNQQDIENWNKILTLMSSKVFCYYLCLFFFTINTVFGPMIAGYFYLQRKENLIIKNIKQQQKDIQPIISELTNEYQKILIGNPL